jgi:hypothetical protein
LEKNSRSNGQIIGMTEGKGKWIEKIFNKIIDAYSQVYAPENW